MYAYCNNSPLSYVDMSGERMVSVASEVVGTVSIAEIETSASCIGIGGVALGVTVAVADGPLPFGDILVCGSTILLTADVITRTQDKSKEKTEKLVLSRTEIKNSQAYFPENPYNFQPEGLIMKEYSGTKNGRIIKWRAPISNAIIFEWDEDFQNGAHYHAMMVEWDGQHKGIHYEPGAPVPEPWNTLYFGGR